eukprot:14429_1
MTVVWSYFVVLSSFSARDIIVAFRKDSQDRDSADVSKQELKFVVMRNILSVLGFMFLLVCSIYFMVGTAGKIEAGNLYTVTQFKLPTEPDWVFETIYAILWLILVVHARQPRSKAAAFTRSNKMMSGGEFGI